MTERYWHPVVRLPLETDLQLLLGYLRQQGFNVHVTEEQGQQQLWVADESQILSVADIVTRWLAGEFKPVEHSEPKTPKASINIALVVVHLFRILPVTLIAILLGVIGYLLIKADHQAQTWHLAEPFFYQPLYYDRFLPPIAAWKAGQYWRLLTPVFLHFTFLHILFNGLVLWELGRRIELAKGSWYMLLVVVLTGVVGNIAQYISVPNTVFGGLSGIVYGLIGYIAIYQRIIRHPVIRFNEAALAFFIVWLLLGVAGIIDFFIPGSVANAAHIAGLLSGVVLGTVTALIDKTSARRQL